RTELEELFRFSWLDEERKERVDSETLDFARLIVAGCLENLDTIDAAIRQQLENWDFTRLAKVDLAILRMSVYSLFFQTDIPASVTIDEAIDIVKEFGSDDSYRFINGVLDGIRKAQETLK
ncbi:MAG TPA: transcription antitermination factor NusB, partial [Spirochaetia bacterium]|nr:transcription antitermination factor NusB [Spirochaetia bacterium]